MFTSPDGHLFFDVPNALWGTLFYIAILISNARPFRSWRIRDPAVFAACLFSFVRACRARVYSHRGTRAHCSEQGLSGVLGYKLYRMGDFCVVCVTTYVINTILFTQAIRDVTHGAQPAKPKQK